MQHLLQNQLSLLHLYDSLKDWMVLCPCELHASHDADKPSHSKPKFQKITFKISIRNNSFVMVLHVILPAYKVQQDKVQVLFGLVSGHLQGNHGPYIPRREKLHHCCSKSDNRQQCVDTGLSDLFSVLALSAVELFPECSFGCPEKLKD